MKRFITLVLTLILLVSSVTAITANALRLTGNRVAEGFSYVVLENKYAMITGITVEKSYQIKDVLEFPEELNGYTVKYIGDDFQLGYYETFDAEYVKKIIIPDTVTYIGDYAFAFDSGSHYDDYVSGVETIELSSNLTYIGSNAFEYNTKLKEINIPETVSYIGSDAFRGCDSLEEVYIPSTVINMEQAIFSCCDNLKRVIIGEGIEKIPPHTFESCDKLKKVVLPDSVWYIGEYAFYNCKSLKSVKVTDDYSYGTKAFGYYKNNKGKVVYNENFKLKVYETEGEKFNNSSTRYGSSGQGIHTYYLKLDAKSKLVYDVRNTLKSKNFKIKLKIDGVEVEKWTSSNPKVATITEKGKLKTVSEGTTLLTATLKDGSTYKRKLKNKM